MRKVDCRYGVQRVLLNLPNKIHVCYVQQNENTMNVDNNQRSQGDPDPLVQFATYKLHNLVDLVVAKLKVLVQPVGFGDSFAHFACPEYTTCSDHYLEVGEDR